MIEVECHISITKDGVCFLNPVRTALLKAIRTTGSLNSAAKLQKISYQHAWAMINDMNTTAPEPLVAKQRGGAHGGGAAITAYGERILNEYDLILKQINKTVDQVNVEINL